MAGFHNKVEDDACYIQYNEQVSQKINDYTLDRNAQMRGQKAAFSARGRQPDFYGPLGGARVTKESYLQGRGHIQSECPNCQVTYLPETLFSNGKEMQANGATECLLEPFYQRMPRNCNSLSETDVSSYHFMPGHWQRGYTGYNSVVDTQLNTRLGLSSECPASQALKIPTNYGTYGSGRDFGRYNI